MRRCNKCLSVLTSTLCRVFTCPQPQPAIKLPKSPSRPRIKKKLLAGTASGPSDIAACKDNNCIYVGVTGAENGFIVAVQLPSKPTSTHVKRSRICIVILTRRLATANRTHISIHLSQTVCVYAIWSQESVTQVTPLSLIILQSFVSLRQTVYA